MMHKSSSQLGPKRFVCFSWLAVVILVAWWPAAALSQDVITVVDGQPVRVSRSGAAPSAAAQAAEVQARAAAEKAKAEAAKKAEAAGGEKKEDEKAGEEKKEEKPETIKRPEKPPVEPDPKELDIELDEFGRVPPFNFQGQPWPAVLTWFKKLSNCTLDFQELPNSYINVSTQRSLPIEDVRDLLNRFLLARGFTMLQRDRVISVFKVEVIDPSLVRQVTELELYNRKRYDFVKVAFELPKSMDVAKAKEDFQQVLSPKARIVPLASTHQILVFDAVANLQTLSEILNEERIREDAKFPLKEFPLEHRRAEEVIDDVYVLLGHDPATKPSTMEMQVQRQKLQIIQQLAQKGKDVAKLLQSDAPPVFLTYNRARNSIIANAPPEQMEYIETIVHWLDVPLGGNGDGPSAAATTSFDDRGMKTYKLKTLDPATFKMTLEEIGDLDPFTSITIDTRGRALFVQGIAADHKKIDDLIKEFDGEEREIHVIPLRRTPADLAAVTIRELMFAEKQEEESSGSGQDEYYSSMASYYRALASARGGGGDTPSANEHEGFYVTADVVNNRLMIRANSEEIKMVRGLLAQMGEMPGAGGGLGYVRFVEPRDGMGSEEFLKQLTSVWGSMGGSELEIKADESQETADESDEAGEEKSEEEKKAEAAEKPANDREVQWKLSPRIMAQFTGIDVAPADSGDADSQPAAAEQRSGQPPTPQPVEETSDSVAAEDTRANADEDTAEEDAGEEDSAQAPSAPPIKITVTKDGRWAISSEDTEALDRLEMLIDQLSPPQSRFKVFPMQHTDAHEMWYVLYDTFKDEIEGESTYMMDWYGRIQNTGDKSSGTGLGRRPKLMITWDMPSNSIMVANASPRQLREIDQLIKVFDRQPRKDSVDTRRNVAIKIKYSRPTIIAATLKEVYIDLLTSRDERFQTEEGRRTGSSLAKPTNIKFGDPGSDGNQGGSPVSLSFNGDLSIGADDVSRMLLISCKEELYDGIVAMVHQLDQEAAPNTSVVVYPVSGKVSAQSLQQAMSETVGRPWLGGQPEQQAARGGRGQQRGNNGENNNRRRNNRGRNNNN